MHGTTQGCIHTLDNTTLCHMCCRIQVCAEEVCTTCVDVCCTNTKRQKEAAHAMQARQRTMKHDVGAWSLAIT